MTNDEWRELVANLAAAAATTLGIASTVQLDPLKEILCSVTGTIGALRGEKDINEAASINPTSHVITLRRLPPGAADVAITFGPYTVTDASGHSSIYGPVNLTTLTDLAKWLVLHELGHIHYGHVDNSDAAEAQANAYAAQHFNDIP